jgi:hypothetical protein
MADIPFASGKDAVFRLFLGGPEVILNAKTWNVKMEGVKAEDGVNGEQRDRLQFIPNYYSLDSECFFNNARILDQLLANIANIDAGVAPLVAAGSTRLRLLDGSRANYVASELCIDDWDFRQGGRTERLALGLPMRFRFFNKGKTASLGI